MATTETSAKIPITIKWNKQTIAVDVVVGESARAFKERIAALTGVPVARQKLLAPKGGWKGMLQNDVVLDAAVIPAGTAVVTLIGSAETLVAPEKKTIFEEDLSPQELQKEQRARYQAALVTCHGWIPALQLPPHEREAEPNKNWEVMQSYNRLVTGMPQAQVEHLLQRQQQKGNNGSDRGSDATSSNYTLQGRVAMEMGLSLRRGYVNDLCTLSDGSLVSAMDDGHLQIWKHAAQQADVVHGGGLFGGSSGGIDSVVSLSSTANTSSHTPAFATGGRGSLQLWTAEGDVVATVLSRVPGTSPTSLQHIPNTAAVMCLAARFKITRPAVDPQQEFRLPPQNEEERQRRHEAVAHEVSMQRALRRAAKGLQVWTVRRQEAQSSSPSPSASASLEEQPQPQQQRLRYTLESQILEPPPVPIGASGKRGAPITCLTTLSLPDKTQFLVAGDSMGGLRLWKVVVTTTNDDANAAASRLQFEHYALYQLTPSLSSSSSSSSDQSSLSCFCRVVCLQALQNGHLAVSTGPTPPAQEQVNEMLGGASHIVVPSVQAVHILHLETSENSQLQSTLTGHVKDAVICMCQLPNGDLLTGGGKLDATLQRWSPSLLYPQKDDNKNNKDNSKDDGGVTDSIVQTTSNQTFSDLGYVLALQVLNDHKDGSHHYAVAAGRYNTVKIMI